MIVYRITLATDHVGVFHLGLGKWRDAEPVALKSMPIGPFDTEQETLLAIVALCDEMLTEQLTLF